MKAYYTYISDSKFVEKKRRLTDAHEKYMTAILICDVFPGLDKNDPLSHPDEDIIPVKFQSKQVKAGEIKFDQMIDEEGEVDEEKLDLQVDQRLGIDSVAEGVQTEEQNETILKVT